MLIFISILFLPLSCLCKPVIVDTSRGSVQGFDHDFGPRTHKTQKFFGYGQIFLGIPYAKTPLGERRFTLPEDIGRSNDRGEVHNATYFRPRCFQRLSNLQPADEMNEDCLYLNVMTPNVTGNYPVMFYLHGGSFTTGGADVYQWQGAVRNLVSRGVVVVTIQYRVGIIGFFTTFTDRFPPNRGFYDKMLALRWVNEEIVNFGGDPSRITIFGQSSGAVSVSDLSLSPLARGLFHQVIHTSGSALVEIETIENAAGSIHQNRAKQICKIDSSSWGSPEKDQALFDCFMRATPQELIAYDNSDGKSYDPSIDGAFLPDYPENLGKTRPKYPTMMLDLLEESAMLVPGFKTNDFSNVTRQDAFDVMKTRYGYYEDETLRNLTEIAFAEYAKGGCPAHEDHLAWAKLITEIFTGAVFGSTMRRDLQWHREAGNEDLWLFTLAHRSILPMNKQIDGWIPIYHCYDLPYLWFYPSIWETVNASEADFLVADYMGDIYTDFAKNGKLPFPRSGETVNYVEITDVLTLKKEWRSDANRVFNEQFPAYLGEFPKLKFSDESWAKLKKTGEKVVSLWNSMNLKPKTKSMKLKTQSVPSSRIAFLMLLLAQCLQVIKSMR